MPATVSNSLAASCCVLPTAMVPTLSLPGLALANASASLSVAKREFAAANTPMSKKPSVVTGAKSFSVSYGSFLNSPTLTALPLLISSSVCPSGRAAATACEATMLPALGLFSTTTGWPSVLPIDSATARAVRSAMPPGAKGTSNVIGRSGKRACADSGRTAPTAARATSTARRDEGR